MKWARRHPTWIAVAVMSLVVGAGAWRMNELSRQRSEDNQARIAEEQVIIRALHADLFCVEDWAARLVGVLRELRPDANQRLEDLFHAFREALNGRQHAARKLAVKAIREDQHYLRDVRAHPVPLPRLRCRLVIPVQHHPKSRPSPHPRPSPRTVTRTRVVPGPVVTRQVTRTVTITAPPGKGHHRQR